jgi:TolB-like protein
MFRRSSLAGLFAVLAASAASAATLESAALRIAAAARSAGALHVSVQPFAVLGAAEPESGVETADRLQGLLARDGRLTLVERSALPRLFAEQAAARGQAPRSGRLTAAQALLLGVVIRQDGRRRVLARLVDAETGEILAAVEAETSEDASVPPGPKKMDESSFPYSRIMDRATDLLGGTAGREDAGERLAAIVESNGSGELRAAAALALGRLDDARSFGLLASAAGDGEPIVRASAALALGLRVSPAAERRLDWIAKSDPDLRVRDAASASLSRARANF